MYFSHSALLFPPVTPVSFFSANASVDAIYTNIINYHAFLLSILSYKMSRYLAGADFVIDKSEEKSEPVRALSWAHESCMIEPRLSRRNTSMSTAVISLIVLAAAVLLGLIRKINIGLSAILAAILLAPFLGVSEEELIGGFNASLFLMLLGVSFLCAAGITNGSLELLAKKTLQLTGGHAAAVPVLLYLVGFGIAAIGPGCIPALGVVAALALPLSRETGYSPVMLAVVGEMGSFAGRFSPLTPESVLIRELTEKQGISGYQGAMIIYALVTTVVLSFLTFLFFSRERKPVSEGEALQLPRFRKGQILTLLAFLAVIAGSVFLGRNVGLTAFVCGIILVMTGAADEKAVFRSISWPTILMITGFGMLMNLVILAGGVELLSAGLASVMSPRTAVAIQGLTAGVMAWFCSAIGVVWPTLLPTVGTVAESIGISPVGLISVMGLTASFAGLSPVSTGGGMIMAATSSDPDFTGEEERRLFGRLFFCSAASLALIVLAALAGAYSIL